MVAAASYGLIGYVVGNAVFAEYLVGGLTPARLRTLAGRVVAARTVIDGAPALSRSVVP